MKCRDTFHGPRGSGSIVAAVVVIVVVVVAIACCSSFNYDFILIFYF